jgi:hypothetical protein
VLTWDGNTPVTQSVLEAGFTIEVDALGNPRISVLHKLEMGDGSMDTAAIISEARARGEKGSAALWALEWGSRIQLH